MVGWSLTSPVDGCSRYGKQRASSSWLPSPCWASVRCFIPAWIFTARRRSRPMAVRLPGPAGSCRICPGCVHGCGPQIALKMDCWIKAGNGPHLLRRRYSSRCSMATNSGFCQTTGVGGNPGILILRARALGTPPNRQPGIMATRPGSWVNPTTARQAVAVGPGFVTAMGPASSG